MLASNLLSEHFWSLSFYFCSYGFVLTDSASQEFRQDTMRAAFISSIISGLLGRILNCQGEGNLGMRLVWGLLPLHLDL